MSQLLFICFNESPLKMMKKAFYFMLKALLVFEMLTVLSWLFVYVRKLLFRFVKKAKINFKIYDVTDRTKHYNAHLLNIPWSICNQIWNLFSKHNIWNASLEKSYTKCIGKASMTPFCKKINIELFSGSTVSNVIKLNLKKYKVIVCPSQSLRKYIESKVPTSCFYLI